jgi:aspartate kinase
MAVLEMEIDSKIQLQQMQESADLYVMKFGGTSVGGARQIESTANIIKHQRNDGKALIVVVSAARGVTDDLLRVCHFSQQSDSEEVTLGLEDILAKHELMINNLDLSFPLRTSLNGKLNNIMSNLWDLCVPLGDVTPEKRDTIVGFGERINAQIVATKLNSVGVQAEAVDATEIIETDNDFGNASPNLEMTKVYAQRRLHPLLENNVVPVVTGFVGATKDYKPTTLGRGGSDYTASILGSVLSAREVWIWTDVDGVYDKDPRENPDASILEILSKRQANAMAEAGAKVLYTKTLRPLMESSTILRVKNTFNPDFPGTTII